MKRRYRLAIGLIVLVGVFFLTAPVGSDQLEDGYAAFQKGDYATALRLWKPLADRGHAGAQFNLGVMYHNGEGVPQDYAEALKWYRKSAEQGDADAQFNLGFMYDNGQGVPQNWAEAGQWFRRTAEQGDAHAQFNLGVMYANGQGVPQDYVQAHVWFNLAAAGLSDKNKREQAVAARDSITAKMTPQQIAEAQALATEWKPKGE